MATFYALFLLAVGVSCQHANHNNHLGLDSDAIYHKIIDDMWLSSDANNDGEFDKFELVGVFAHYDDNGDGIVHYHEYMDNLQKHTAMWDYSHALFSDFDANHDHKLDSPDIDLLFDKMDTDGTNGVSKAEFTAYWLGMLRKTATLHGHGLHLGHHG